MKSPNLVTLVVGDEEGVAGGMIFSFPNVCAGVQIPDRFKQGKESADFEHFRRDSNPKLYI